MKLLHLSVLTYARYLNAEFTSAYAKFFKRAVLKSVFSIVLFLLSAIMAPTERFFPDFEYAKRISELSVRD